jgi:hypothetical protein
MITNKLTITKADKGKILVILTQEECKHKLNSSIQVLYKMKITNNLTQQYQQIMKQTLKQCNIIQKVNRWKYMILNPTAPKLHATIKIYKLNTPIRPISM